MPKKVRKGRGIVLWFIFVASVMLVVAIGYGIIPSPLPPLELGPYSTYIVVLLILLTAKLLLELIRPLFKATLKAGIPSEADILSLFQVFSYLVWIAVFIIIIYLTFGGGAAFGFLGTAIVSAALIYVMQKPLLNIVGWAILVTKRLYKLGDRIEMNNVRGYVVHISTMSTIVREFGAWMSGDSFTGRHVTIPNSCILEGNVSNYTKDTPFIWDELQVSVTYESDLRAAERHILDAANEVVGDLMKSNKDLVRKKYEFKDLSTFMVEEPSVRWRMEDSCVSMTLLFFCPAHRRRYYKSEITKRILEKFSVDKKVQIAYPHLQIVSQGPDTLRMERE